MLFVYKDYSPTFSDQSSKVQYCWEILGTYSMQRNVRHVSLTQNQGFIELFFFLSFGTGKLAVVSVSAVHAVCSSGTMWMLLPLGLLSLPF